MRILLSIVLIGGVVIGVIQFEGELTLNSITNELEEKDIPYEKTDANENSVFNMRLQFTRPDVLIISEEDQLYVYVLPANWSGKYAEKQFRRKTASMDLASFEIYSVKNILIIYQYDRNLDDFNPAIDGAVQELIYKND
ncbi:hypothetical protein [Pseudalkalibacillus caeni]|uniref:Uncharacterized protein n=1 Tax=Exobacillus caeni TaxID=2574798 RepID=A0A5R9F9G6_9BACL|nr:hypothetical protein [Pseudalkalibacillus caeni]TLS37194.1 hypothetical protein FCL54_11750 [Pseudalkalibacillus caeni]